MLNYACPVPVIADFQITGLIQGNAWNDPSNLEAARTLLQARYDLKLGIWDLAENPTLRRTLLESAQILAAPGIEVVVPKGAAERAERQVAKKMAAKAVRRAALETVAPELAPLIRAGWRSEPLSHAATFTRPLAEEIQREWDAEPFPLVRLELTITKRSCEVGVFNLLYNQVNGPEYVKEHRQALERIANPDACSLASARAPSLWRANGGWGDAVDWVERAARLVEMTPKWAKVLEGLCEEVRLAYFGSRDGATPVIATIEVSFTDGQIRAHMGDSSDTPSE